MKSYKERTQDILARAAAERAVRSKRIQLSSVIAAGLALVLVLNLVLFLPYNTAPPNLSRFSGSDYYSLMQQINRLTYRAPQYNNNFEAWFGDLLGGGVDDEVDEPASPGDTGDDTAYSEVTDNQVEGVIEGDLFKRAGDTFFYLNTENADIGYTLQAYSIAQEESALLAEYTVQPEEGTTFRGYAYAAELYLSEDGGTVTLFTPAYAGESRQVYTAVITIDVSDPAHMREEGRTYLSGSYVSSRKVGDEFLLVSNFVVRSNPDFADESQFLPQAGALDSLESLAADSIVQPAEATAARYTVIARFTEGQADISDCIALFSFTDDIYVSQNNIFAPRSYTAEGYACGEELSYEFTEQRTEIAAISYAGGTLRYLGSADLPGTVKDQYSMDERDGRLRVVTTLRRSIYRVYGGETISIRESGTNAGVYIVRLDDFQTEGSLEWFAPEGETVRSVRFEKQSDAVWVCTAVELTDPVFRIDLSDPQHITYTDTGTISGYSLSLVDFTGGTLLGIGYGDSILDLKIELYEEVGSAVLPLSSVIEENTDFSADYKAYLIDRDRGLVGLHIYSWNSELGAAYLLLHFDGYSLVEAARIPLASEHCGATRAAIADGWLYILTDNSADYTAVPLGPWAA